MSKTRSAVAVATVLAGAAMAMPALTSAVTTGAVLDQSAAPNACNSDVGPTQSLTETFTAGRTGALTDVVVPLINNASDAPLTVSIVATSAGAPDSSSVLATADVQTSQVGNSWTDVDVAFTSPAQVVTGTQYAITMTSSSTTDWLWECASPEDYAGGQFYYNHGGVGSWTGLSFYDLTFSTYVLAQSRSTTRTGYCAAAGDSRLNGAAIAPGTFLDLLDGQPATDSHYAGATPAVYVQGKGITCDAPPTGWTQQGRATSGGRSQDPGAPYAYFAPPG